MNKIFKVIWSKSKQCYVVVSEMAKNTTGKKKIVVAGILASLMMQPLATMDVDANAFQVAAVSLPKEIPPLPDAFEFCPIAIAFSSVALALLV